MAKNNYQYEKRMRDLAKKKKNEEKRQRKLEKNAAKSDDATSVDQPHDDARPDAGQEIESGDVRDKATD
ncbi:MAG TPA: hypothetical protein PKM65_05445 [Spirochaetota bacterium]|nr:hypothetical protein [Spirochaetota bacterium]HNT10202.1 hypothetical protein [Spirochaetota bacterium]HNV46395.1 hypothetical protein [Spirochaetota bacterium]HOS41913.1 hypothetical protein [Spirochaetota bacterium]HPI22540.1 hypothetical protein [Spirochaetota bacterium]